jgi:diguanylate cyclase (GGDEF)-like protein
MSERRRTHDRRHSPERRTGFDRRRQPARPGDLARAPSWEEQRAQYFTRFFYWSVGLAYLNLGFEPAELRVPTLVVNILLPLGMLVHAVGLWHAWRAPSATWRLRATMWLDLAAVTFSVLADPAVPSPGFLVYVVVILGNGLRYGMRYFAEAVFGSFIAGLVALGLRHEDYLMHIRPSVGLFLVFGGILALYAYALNARIERTRQQLEIERGLDELTGLLNRRAFQERAEPLFRTLSAEGATFTVLFADLDGFKSVNDTHGHHTGDRVLATLGRTIGGMVRHSDMVARYGGDEFVLLLPDTDLERAHVVARRLQGTVEEWSRGNNVSVSLSVGMGQFPQPDCDLKTALARVDQAMYQGRVTRGRGGICVVEPARAT